MKIFQKEITLAPRTRGFHLITNEILKSFPFIAEIKTGMFSVFIKHTSASLCINENADPTVRGDFERHFNLMVPESAPYFKHTMEGPDDMPGHIKAALLGNNIQVPITAGELNLGTWQGIYFCEHRDEGGKRTLVLTAFGI